MPSKNYVKTKSEPSAQAQDLSRSEELIRLHAVTHKQRLVTLRKQLIAEALKLEGAPSVKYRNPTLGKDPVRGFDCSGFVVYLLNNIYPEFSNLPLQKYPRHSNKFFDRYGIFIEWGNQKPGDLIFIYRQSRGWYIDHMGIMVDKNHYIHAPGKDGTKVQVLRLDRRWKMKNRDNNAHYLYNPVGFKRIAVEQGRWRVA